MNEKEWRKRVGINIRNRMYELHMTQRELASKAGITESALSHYIRGDRIPHMPQAIRLARALETNLDVLFCGHMRIDYD